MKVQNTVFKLPSDCIKNTKLTADEMRKLSLQEACGLMIKKEHHLYTDVD